MHKRIIGIGVSGCLLFGSAALAQQQTFQLEGRVVALVDDLGVFSDVSIDDQASAFLTYDPGNESLAPLDGFGRAEFDIQDIQANVGGLN